MALSGTTWRKHPFEIGRRYVAAQSFHGVPEFEFVAGRSYELVHIGHSHYDGCTVLTFKENETSQKISWWWADDEPESTCVERFQIA